MLTYAICALAMPSYSLDRALIEPSYEHLRRPICTYGVRLYSGKALYSGSIKAPLRLYEVYRAPEVAYLF
jgi:hypothetical protein